MIAYIYFLRLCHGLKSKSLSSWLEFCREKIRSDAQGVVICNSDDIRTIWRKFIEGIFCARGPFDTVTHGKEVNLESLTDV